MSYLSDEAAMQEPMEPFMVLEKRTLVQVKRCQYTWFDQSPHKSQCHEEATCEWHTGEPLCKECYDTLVSRFANERARAEQWAKENPSAIEFYHTDTTGRGSIHDR